MSNQLHSVLRFRQSGSLVQLQPFRGQDIDGDTLSIDLATGSIRVQKQDKLDKNFDIAFGIAGLAQLATGFALALIIAGENVGTLREHLVWKVTKAVVLTEIVGGSPADATLNSHYTALLREAFNPAGAGRGLFFSFDADVTLTQQRYATISADSAAAGRSLHDRADPRFYWNRHLTQKLLEEGAGRFAMPLLQGSFHQMRGLKFRAHDGSITLVGRRAAQRAGVRHWRRGADPQGRVANCVETEQLIELSSPKGTVLSSFVQLRGSIPLMWSQIPNIKYKPTTRIAPPDTYARAFDRHVTDLLDIYKDVDAINLINQHGSEGVLCQALEKEAARFAKSTSGFRLISFDFHKQCGAKKYHNLEKLWGEVEGDFERWGFYAEGGGGGPARQGGVFRTNCIDCLDRTNVVQGLLGRKHLEHVLQRAGLLPEGTALQTAYPAVFNQFRIIWADHGDDVSRQYAGTGALKSGFTRTGKRTYGGLLDDGVKSAMRYYLNNFTDGAKQDAIDFATGNYTVQNGKPSPFTDYKSPTLPLLAATVSIAWALCMAVLLLAGKGDRTVLNILQVVIAPLVIGIVTLSQVVKRGAELVRQPQLCPFLAQPWD
jgi:hypothetical protein